MNKALQRQTTAELRAGARMNKVHAVAARKEAKARAIADKKLRSTGPLPVDVAKKIEGWKADGIIGNSAPPATPNRDPNVHFPRQVQTASAIAAALASPEPTDEQQRVLRLMRLRKIAAEMQTLVDDLF